MPWSAVVSAFFPDTTIRPLMPRSKSISMCSSSVTPSSVAVHSTVVNRRPFSKAARCWAMAGKTGLFSSGMSNPTSPARL